MKLEKIINWVEAIAPLHLQEGYDNSGLIIGHENQEVSKVVVCLDVDDAVLSYARDNDAELVISHHPCVFKPLKAFHPRSPEGAILYQSITSGIAVYSAHTNFDSARGGMGDIICREMGLDEVGVLRPNSIANSEYGIGRWGSYKTPMPFKGFLKILKNKLGIEFMREVGEHPDYILTLAVLNGSYDDSLINELINLKPDVLLTGDLKYHDAQELRHQRIYTIDAGHYQTEVIFVRAFASMLKEAFPKLDVLEWKGSDIFKVIYSID